jgi:glycosyltransferase involved in cell wall biosynthesis
VSLALGGGVARHVTERAESLAKQGLSTLILEPSKTDSTACILRDGNGQLKHLRYSVDKELTTLPDLLLGLSLAHIEIHHFLGHSPKLIETIRSLGVPYDIYIHDYSWICPRITLMSGETGYCGEPKVSACETCIKTHGSNIQETITVRNLRARSAKWLKSARNVIAPTNDVATRLARYFPELRQTVTPWEQFPATIVPLPPRGTTIRVAVIGAINASKGYRVLLACARDAAKRKLDIEFLVIGYTENDEPLMRTGKAFVTGKFREDEVSALLARERPHLILYSSVWPETWCYTLTHALKANLPIIAFDIGAIAERLREAGVGTLVSPKIPSVKLNDLILSAAAKVWQNKVLHTPNSSELSQMSRKQLRTLATNSPVDSGQAKLDTAIINPGQLGALAVGELAATVKPIDLDRGLYTFSVRTASPGTWGDAATLFVPAVQVAIGPGVSAEVAEFIPGLPERGAWLYQSGDALVVNVKAQSATLLVTSIRSFGSEPLAIEVERVGESGGGTTVQHGIAAISSGFSPDQAAVPLTRAANRLEILAHIQNRGDIRFVDAHWAGRIGPGLAIEALSIKPLEPLAPGDIEYKGLTATGFETPWVTDGGVCGTKGKSTPLIGFALRLKRTAVKQFDCEYLGYFRSGRTVGPFRNGAPCRSTVSNDPLEGIHIRLIAKEKGSSDKKSSHENGIGAAKERPAKPKFGQFRDILESGDSPSDTASKTPPSILENPAKVKGAKDRKPVKTRAPEAHKAASPEPPSTTSPEKPERT